MDQWYPAIAGVLRQQPGTRRIEIVGRCLLGFRPVDRCVGGGIDDDIRPCFIERPRDRSGIREIERRPADRYDIPVTVIGDGC